MTNVNTNVAATRARPMTRDEKRVILASSAGTIFEWYDFYLYGSLAAIIGAQYFTSFPRRRATFSHCWPLPRASSCVRSARWCSARSAIWWGANTPS